MNELLEKIRRTFEKHGIKDSPLQILVLAELKATQDLLINLHSNGNEKTFDLIDKTLVQSETDSLVAVIHNLYGEKVLSDFESDS